MLDRSTGELWFIVYLWGIEIKLQRQLWSMETEFIVYLWGIEMKLGNKRKIWLTEFIVYLWGIEIYPYPVIS